MQICQNKIDFVGMIFNDGQYTPSLYIALKLDKFLDSQLSIKQVQQFLGIVNYLGNFISYVTRLTKPLQQMLKKDSPPWSKKQTIFVKQLNKVTKQLPLISIPSDGHCILQTDTGNKFWEPYSLKKRTARKVCMGIKVESSKILNSTITQHSNKCQLSNITSKNLNFTQQDITSW